MSKKHASEIKLWANSPEDTKVWVKPISSTKWELVEFPTWSPKYPHIVNNEFAELKKAYMEGKQIEINHISSGWEITKYPKFNGNIKNYRIKDDEVYEWQWVYKISNDDPHFYISHYYLTDKKDFEKMYPKGNGNLGSRYIPIEKYEPSKRLRKTI